MTDNNTEPTHPPVSPPSLTEEEWRANNPDSKAAVPMMECETWIPPSYTYYTFTAMREFSAFCMSGHGPVGPSQAIPSIEFCQLSEEQKATADTQLVEKIEASCIHLTKAAANSVGGCGCNRSKRLEQAIKVYEDTITIIAKSPEVCDNVKKLLNSVERVHFWKDGQKYSNQARVCQMSNSPGFDWRNAPPPSPLLII